MAGHILLAEDDKALSALMQDFFRAAGERRSGHFRHGTWAGGRHAGRVPRGRGRLHHETVFVSGAGGESAGAHAAGPRAAAGRE